MRQKEVFCCIGCFYPGRLVYLLSLFGGWGHPRKYCMRPLQNIVDLSLFSSLVSEGKCSHSSLPWWDDCIYHVELQVLTDRTTSRDNLREKAKNYASNYIAMQTEGSFIQKDWFLEDIADDHHLCLYLYLFPEDPEKRFIKLR